MRKALLCLLLMISCDGSAIPLKPIVRWGGAGTAIIGALTALAMHNRVKKLMLQRKALLLLQEQGRGRSVQERWTLLNALLFAEKKLILSAHYRRLGLVAAGAGVAALGGSFLMPDSDNKNDDNTSGKEQVRGQDLAVTSGMLQVDFGAAVPSDNALAKHGAGNVGVDSILALSNASQVPVANDVIQGVVTQLQEKIKSKEDTSREVQSIFKTLLLPVRVPGDGSCGIHTIAFWQKWRDAGGQNPEKIPTRFRATPDLVARQRLWLLDEAEKHINAEISGKDVILVSELYSPVAGGSDADLGQYYWVRNILGSYLDIESDQDAKPVILAAFKQYKDRFGKKGSTDWLDVPLLHFVAKEMKCPVVVWAKNAKTGGFDVSSKINFEGWDGDLSKVCHAINYGGHWEPAILKPEVVALLAEQKKEES
ncbi:MAG: hypothetical protein QG632_427 [Candidatus Dependentiae bacterium]|nr:hypothetical protein [Candidatus Dependentiae bacterium]